MPAMRGGYELNVYIQLYIDVYNTKKKKNMEVYRSDLIIDVPPLLTKPADLGGGTERLNHPSPL